MPSKVGAFYSIAASLLKSAVAMLAQIGMPAGAGKLNVMAIEKKRETRRSVHQPGLIALEGGFARRKCSVVDLSQTGARLSLEDASPLTKVFTLSLNGDMRRGFRCELVWQRGKTAGVRFSR